MKSLLKASFAVLLCAASALTASAQSVVVYDNSTGDSGVQYTAASGVTYGNQVVLSGTERTISEFIFQYWGTGLNAGATAEVTFYANNGTTDAAGYNPKPSTVLFDSGTFHISNGTNIVTFSEASLDGGVVVPDTFTWAVTFNYSVGSAGLSVFNGHSVGNTLNGIWYLNNSSGWELRLGDGTGTSFAAQISAVPEPSTFALLGMGAFAFWKFYRRQTR